MPAETIQAPGAMRSSSISLVCAVPNRARWLSPDTDATYVALAESRIADEHAA